MTKTELGDYQTPQTFSLEVAKLLKEKYSIRPSFILEPTVGLGSFIYASLETFEGVQQVFGIDINQEYIDQVKKNLAQKKISHLLECTSIFEFDFNKILQKIPEDQDLLCLGNPPWVTNSQLSSNESQNQPIKINFRKLRGIEAITGKSNFDIAEYILLKTMAEISNKRSGWYAFLVKSIVARNLFKNYRDEFNFKTFDVYHFDAMKVFDVACDAVLMVIQLSSENSIERVNEFDFSEPYVLKKQYGFVNGRFVSDAIAYDTLKNIDGSSPIQWRQGIKHDCSKVMELTPKGNGYINGLGEDVTHLSSSPFVYPLIKSSEIKGGKLSTTKKKVIVTQTKPGDPTEKLKKDQALWEYLNSHTKYFEQRKSVIYKKAQKFAIFGIGSYSFCEYKIAVSGLYKEPHFTFVHASKPVMLDDTGYFVYTSDKKEAALLFAILSSPACTAFIKAISFSDSKRPFTKESLQRIDFYNLMVHLGYDHIKAVITKEFNEEITIEEFEKYLNKYQSPRGLI